MMRNIEDFNLLNQAIDEHLRWLYMLLKKKFNFSKEENEDIIQEARIRLFKSKSTFQGGVPPSTFVYAVVNNIGIDHLRKENRSPKAINYTNLFWFTVKDMERMIGVDAAFEEWATSELRVADLMKEPDVSHFLSTGETNTDRVRRYRARVRLRCSIKGLL